ncbi:hypothetical protein GYMLUDRAFT_64572 [Collybiopsis luxurians FD-317 M1]|uniref:DUF6532 domain-containing protein n=1 Tax=Collybiopsis luxurians FD-317 M1 TaxID=944289 RepID=A0A0D0C225_9AGAR|nr:hypothetical protein GYMLUDRAFT_64572 [Collybiopsis luxurians FD-317 M1]
MQTKVKKAAVSVVAGLYGLQGLSDDQGKKLAEDLWKARCYVFPLSNPLDTMTWRRNKPFDHPEILSVLKKAFFANPDLPGIVYNHTSSLRFQNMRRKRFPSLCFASYGSH